MIQFDFDTVKQRILTTLSSKSEWAEFLSYGTNSLLLDSIVQEMVYQTQYKEYLTYENWWSNARNKSSLLVQAPVHGYVVPRKKGAVGTLRVSSSETFNAIHPQNIFIPKYFQFSNGTTYVVSNSDYILTPVENYVDLICRQGEYKYLTFQATGSLFETKEILDSDIENSLYTLYVNDVLWTRVDSLFEYSPTDIVYELITSPSFDKITIKFGNDIFGKKLQVNDVVKFQYISTLGSKGNILTLNNIDTVESQAYDALGQPIDLYVKNITAITGGVDYPSIEEIRALSPKVYQTGDRASSRDDYETIINQLDNISKATVWGAYETNLDTNVDPWTFISTEENVIHLAALTTAYENLSTLEKQVLIASIYEKTSPTDIVQFEDVEKVNLIFNVNAIVLNSSYSLSQVKSAIIQMLSSTYDISVMDFNQDIYASDLSRLIDEVSGVRNHNSTVQIKKEFLFSSMYVADISVPIFPMNGTSTKFYIKNTVDLDSTYTLLATTDGNGVITGSGVYTTLGSSINLATGLGTLIVTSGLVNGYSTYTIKVLYESYSDDLILTSRNKLFKYSSSNVSVSYPF